MRVLKFGGTSVADAVAIERVISIIKSKLDFTPVIVVSALSKVTDTLYRIAEHAGKGEKTNANELIASLNDMHINLCRDLFGDDNKIICEAKKEIESITSRLAEKINAITVLGELSERCKASIVAQGEILSSYIIYLALNHSSVRTKLVDARELIYTDDNYMKGEPDLKKISEEVPKVIKREFKGYEAVITQGFISSTKNGVTTVLGRGGSDYTASLIGMAIDASEVEIWTDVDGILTADPRKIPNSKRINLISFEEAAELAHFGAKVLHPMTIQPAIEKNIPVRILNSRLADAPGTLILEDSKIPAGVKSISCKEKIIVLNIFSTRMVNSYGFLHKLFKLFDKYHIPVDLISSSEANVSLTIEEEYELNELILTELSAFSTVSVERDKSQVSVIGKELNTCEGVYNRVFCSLSDYKINMISQGASSINISFVVKRADLNDIITALHRELFEKNEIPFMKIA
jgi:aspartate kinase